jgi:hypothetical protein
VIAAITEPEPTPEMAGQGTRLPRITDRPCADAKRPALAPEKVHP